MKARRSRRLLGCGVAGPVIFVASFAGQGAVRPGYDPLRHPVSALALGGPGAWVQTATFLITGALLVAYAVGLWQLGEDDGVRLRGAVAILIMLVALGLVGAGVFACDPIGGYPPGSPVPAPRTPRGVAHDLFSTPVFTCLPAAACVVAVRCWRVGRWGWAAYSVVSGVLVIVFFVLASVGFAQHPALASTAGLWQRCCLVIGFGWLAAVAVRLLRQTSSPTRG